MGKNAATPKKEQKKWAKKNQRIIQINFVKQKREPILLFFILVHI